MNKGVPNETLFRKIAKYARGKRTLDIGCGNKAYSHVSGNTVTLDGWDKTNPDVLINLEDEDLPFKENQFECVLMLDFIEHMSRERGEAILEQAKVVTSGRLYMLTPLWWDTNEKHTNDPTCWAYGNKLNNHLSLWKREDFAGWEELGFKVNGEEYFFGFWEK
ncbi:MAG: hypothetical protein ACXABD_11935 [Candidatus Thorarchaeota archaeon]|jgi:hypothetical protein